MRRTQGAVLLNIDKKTVYIETFLLDIHLFKWDIAKKQYNIDEIQKTGYAQISRTAGLQISSLIVLPHR